MPFIDESLTIVGLGQSNTIIDGANGLHRAFTVCVYCRMPNSTAPLIQVNLENLALNGVKSAVLSEQTTLTDVTVTNSGNVPTLNVLGYHAPVAALYQATLNRVTMNGNNGLMGGGVSATILNVADSSFTDNLGYFLPVSVEYSYGGGGAIYMGRFNNAPYGTNTITRSTFSNNSSEGAGGAVYIEKHNYNTNSQRKINISHSTFTNNTAEESGGAVYVQENITDLQIWDSTFTGNQARQGGAIDFKGFGYILNSTLSQNSAEIGGAINGLGYILNSTFSANTATISGAAVDGPSIILNSTFSGHNTSQSSGVSLLNSGVFSAFIGSSIIANNNAADPFECGTNIYSFGILSDDPNCFGHLGEATGVDPVLRDNGGSTYTHRLLAGSNAIDNEPIIENGKTGCDLMEDSWFATYLNLTLTDQRGIARPYGNACDLGAYEYDEEPAPDYGLILNGGFETAGTVISKPDSWTGKQFTAGDKRVCVADESTLTAPDGTCVYQFWSSFRPNISRSIVQSITGGDLGAQGDTLTLSALVEGQNFGAGASIVVEITYTDGASERQVLAIPAGTYAFTEITTPIALTGTPADITISVMVNKASGRLRLDAVRLMLSDADALIPFPATESRPGATLDLPAAPDGFRN